MYSLTQAFQSLPDYRKIKITKNNPGEILLLSLMAILSGAEGFFDIAQWMKVRKREIERLLNKHFSPPAYTTIRNVFLGIDIDEVNKLQKEWVEKISDKEGKTLTIVAADGKTIEVQPIKPLIKKQGTSFHFL